MNDIQAHWQVVFATFPIVFRANDALLSSDLANIGQLTCADQPLSATIAEWREQSW